MTDATKSHAGGRVLAVAPPAARCGSPLWWPRNDWREGPRAKTASFLVLGAVLVACILNNLLAFRLYSPLWASSSPPEPAPPSSASWAISWMARAATWMHQVVAEGWGVGLPVYLLVTNVGFFLAHQALSAWLHPRSVTLATSPVPLLSAAATAGRQPPGTAAAANLTWRGLLGRQLMLWFEFLTNKLGVALLCLHLGFLLHLWLLSPQEGRSEMTVLDARLGRPLPEKDYGEGCDDIGQVYDSLYDFFVFVHFVGFMLMAGCMRNFAVPFAIGVFDELLELSLQHIFPNFRECWWDHFIADIFGANLLGCLTGYLITHVTEIQPLTWLSPKPLNEPSPKASFSLFPSPLFTKVYDLFLGSDKRPLIFLSTLFIHRIACFVIPFAFKYVMWVPVPHLIFIWYGVCQFGLQLRFYAELYQHLAASYAEDKLPKHQQVMVEQELIRNSDLGIWRYQWRIINFLILALETGFILKTLFLAYSNLTPPDYIIGIWILLAVALTFCLSVSLDRKSKPANKSKPAPKRKMP